MATSEKVVIIIPTYNERENIGVTIEKLERIFPMIPDYNMHILIYDSNSPDDTRAVVETYLQCYKNITLLSEEKKSGLGNAYKNAMCYADQHLGADIVFEFDADGSHDPKYLPEMMRAFSRGASVVMGSRYVFGGSIPRNWALHRKLLSVLGNLLAKIILSSKIKDYTTGFRGTRVSALRKLKLSKITSPDYAYKIHLIWLLQQQNENIVEIPIDFIDRKKGMSKLPKNNITESLGLIIRLRTDILKRQLRRLLF